MPKGEKLEACMGHATTAVDAAVLVAGLVPTHRECSIEIENKCSNYVLCQPSVHTESGFCAECLPLTIDPSTSGKALFCKTANTARGAVGVFTYDLCNKSTKESTEKIAVMFSVPFDFNLYSNWYAVGIFDKSTECNYDLYNKMYNNTDKTFVRKKAGQSLNYKNDSVTIVAIMSDSNQPELKVEVKDN